jgi:tRNA 2-selenouridine synthase
MPPPNNLVTIDSVELASYQLVIDARSPREYAEDHVPGATNLPVVGDAEYAEVGTLHRTDTHQAYLTGVTYSLRNIAGFLPTVAAAVPRGGRILVYCFRGGKRSRLWCDALETIGFRVHRLQGGWKSYRHWVNAQLPVWAARFTYYVLCGPTGCGKTRLLHALQQQGTQVLDLEGLANHRGSLIGAIPDSPQPSQKWFDSLLLRQLMGFDLDKPIWTEAESKKIGALQLPAALFETMHAGRVFSVTAPMPARVKLWREDYRHFEENPAWLIERLQPLGALVGGNELSEWQHLADSRQMPALFQRLMENHYDPAYERSIARNYPTIGSAQKLQLSSLDGQDLATAAASLVRAHAKVSHAPPVTHAPNDAAGART